MKLWSNEEIETIKNNYPMLGAECNLPGRTKDSLYHKAKILGVRHIGKPLPNISERKLGWIEGIIDGEGCFQLSGQKKFRIILTVTNTNKDLLIKLKEVIGSGSISKSTFGWTYSVCAHTLRKLLPKIGLIVRERQRLLILEALNVRNEGKSLRNYERLVEIKKELTKVNSNKGNSKGKANSRWL